MPDKLVYLPIADWAQQDSDNSIVVDGVVFCGSLNKEHAEKIAEAIKGTVYQVKLAPEDEKEFEKILKKLSK